MICDVGVQPCQLGRRREVDRGLSHIAHLASERDSQHSIHRVGLMLVHIVLPMQLFSFGLLHPLDRATLKLECA